MTIYAVVNNLLSFRENHQNDGPIWTVISPSAILQGGNPFFVPDFSDSFEARVALAIKIGKLGKGIAPRFANRYVDSIAPAILFVAADLLQTIKASGLPWTSAISYDRSLALGKFIRIPFEECKKCNIIVSLHSHDTSAEIMLSADSILPNIEETIAAISRDNALKIGDIILLGITGNGPEVIPDMRADIQINGIDSLSFNIR